MKIVCVDLLNYHHHHNQFHQVFHGLIAIQTTPATDGKMKAPEAHLLKVVQS